MPLMTLKDTRVVDKVLSQVVYGYKQSDFIGDTLFPYIDVDKREGKLIAFNKDEFMTFDSARGPGAATRRVHVRWGTDSYYLKQDRLEGELTVEHLEEVAGTTVDLRARAVMRPMKAIMLGMEKRQSLLATTASNYATSNKVTLSGSSMWDQATSTPSKNIREWKNIIRTQIGTYPNTMVMGSKVFDTLIEHPEAREKLKYTTSDVLSTGMISQMFGIPTIKVGQSLILGPNDVLTDIWGSVVVMAYIPPAGIRAQEEPSYGYTYRLRGYPMVEREYYDDNHRTWYFPVTLEAEPQLTGMNAGFLASNVVV